MQVTDADNRPWLLLVDDEKINLNLLVELLRNDYRLMAAKDGLQALQRARGAVRPDLILLDVMMPGLDGYEVCRQLKADPVLAGIPVIFVTSRNVAEDEARGLALGAVDYIGKPISPPVVLARVKTHLMLQRQRCRLEELNEVKNRFLGMAAHDLRTPIANIHSMSELLLEEGVDAPTQQRFLQMIQRVSGQMLTLVNDLLDISAIESGRFDLQVTRGDLNALFQERLAVAAPRAQDKGITLLADWGPARACDFDGDRLGQVMDNLLSNALKYSPTGTTVRVSTAAGADGVSFAVADQGPGIAPAERDRLFGAFQKLSSQPTAGEKSTGLGLCIVKQIVEHHHGRIEVESEVGRGATFRVWLPG